MAYGDGSFFFTQPVGNGYSGLGSFGPQLSSPVRGRKAPVLAPPAFAKFQGSDSTSGSSAAAVSSYCLEPGASCTLAEIDAELARVSAISRGSGVTLSRRQTLMGLNNLRNALLAAMATTAEDTTTMGPVVTNESTDGGYDTWNVSTSDLAADQSTMDILMPELPPEDALMQDVSLDIEAESSGIMGWVQDNMLLSAAIAGTVGFFGYRYAKKQGMI
jgi:hypothetical protein